MNLKELYIELDAVEDAQERTLARFEWVAFNKRRAELLGEIKPLERDNA